MNTFIRHSLWIFLGLSSLTGFAQQEAIYGHFLNQKSVINPAYVGYRNSPNVTVIHRSQWVGFKGAPTSDFALFDMPLKRGDMAVGGGLSFDKIGPTREIGLMADYSYLLRLGNRTTLSFGAKASLSVFQVNLMDLDLISDYYGESDDLFNYNPGSLLMPNVGFGIYYYGEKFFVGISSPKMLRRKFTGKDNVVYAQVQGTTEPTGYLMGGGIFELNRYLDLKISSLTRATRNAPLSTGLYVSALYDDMFDAGLYYFYKEVAGAYFTWNVNKRLMVGYNVDFATNALITTNYGSHELMVNYYLKPPRRRIIYPRYF